MPGVLDLIPGFSSLKTLGIVAVIIGAMVAYHFYDEAIDAKVLADQKTAYATLQTEKEQLNTKYQTEKKDHQTALDSQATSEEKYANLWARYDVDMHSCNVIKDKQAKETARLRMDKKRLEEFIKANPGSGLQNALPDVMIDIINGK